MSERFRIASTKSGAIDIVFFIGRLDAVSSVKAEEFLSDLIQNGSRQIGIHGGELSYLSSAGLRVILGSMIKIRELGGDIRLSNLKPDIREIISMCGFDDIFAIYSDDTAIIASFGE
jgi:anti-sigma B factor antagonist